MKQSNSLVVKFLIDHGADVQEQEAHDFMNSITYAFSNGEEDLAKQMVQWIHMTDSLHEELIIDSLIQNNLDFLNFITNYNYTRATKIRGAAVLVRDVNAIQIINNHPSIFAISNVDINILLQLKDQKKLGTLVQVKYRGG